MFSLKHKDKAFKSSPTCRSTPRCRPSLEVLEERAMLSGTNLIFNGDFETGNVGFTSDYRYLPGNIGPGTVYDILRNPSQAHHLGIPYGDHTSGAGFMMAVNGAMPPNHNASVWSQTVAVTSKTEYTFSAWISNTINHPASPRQLSFFINGISIGITTTPSIAGVWQPYTTTWNSDSSHTATINIIAELDANGNTAADFALDDISFCATARSDLVATSLTWNAAEAGVDFGYKVEGTDLTQDTTATLYWA